jgi:hypothetical protein
MHYQIETSLKHTLTQLHQLLELLSDEEYSRPLDTLSGSSIGQHTRHIIEFLQTLSNGYPSGVVNYDRRQRNKVLESNCKLAQQELADMDEKFSKDDKKILLVGSYSSNGGEESTVESTYYRELVYNLEHAIHHMAIIRIAIRNATTVEVPADFGVAAATIKYKRSLPGLS